MGLKGKIVNIHAGLFTVNQNWPERWQQVRAGTHIGENAFELMELAEEYGDMPSDDSRIVLNIEIELTPDQFIEPKLKIIIEEMKRYQQQEVEVRLA